MELNLQPLFFASPQPECGEISLCFAEKDFGGFTLEGPVWAGYTVLPQNGAVVLDVKVEAVLVTVCARCLADIKRPWQFTRSFRITPQNLQEEFPELPFTGAGGLDMDELVFAELLMDVDPVLLCRNDCPGLCQTCGQHKGECHCIEQPTGDPRLQVLKQLLE